MTKSTFAYSMAQPEILNGISSQLAAIFTNMTTQIAATMSTMPIRKLFDDYMDEWFSLKSQNLSQKTLEDYQGLYNTHVKPKFSNIYLDDITASRLDKYYNELLQTLSPATANKIKSCIIGPALRKAVAQGLLQNNPTIGLEPIRVENKHHEAYTLDELSRLQTASQGSYWWIAVPLLVATGIRRAELLGLRWTDYDPEKRTLHIERDYISTNHGCEFTTTKTQSSQRIIALSTEICSKLDEYRRHEGAKRTYIISQHKADAPVDPHNFSRSFRKWCQNAGIPKSKWGGHSTRATYCTLASETSCSLDGVRRQVGHSDFRMLSKVYMRNKIAPEQYNVADSIGSALRDVMFSDAK